MAHLRCRRDAIERPTRSAASAGVSARGVDGGTGGGGAGSVSVLVSLTLAVSVDGLTVRAAFIAGLALAALVLTGWRKPARAEPRSPRGPDDRVGIVVDHLDTQLYRRPGVVRRLLAAILSGGIGLLVGVLTAIVVAFGTAWAVIWMTNLLHR